jgi:hypothetical protein
MIRHIVLWRFLDRAEGGTKEENLRKAKAMLDALPRGIPEILSFETGIGVTHGDRSFDLALNGTFDSVASLEAYQRHPGHLGVVKFLRRVQSEKSVVDYAVSPP